MPTCAKILAISSAVVLAGAMGISPAWASGDAGVAAKSHNRADARAIVEQSARVTEADRKASAEYDYTETDLKSDGSHETFSVRMLYGSPYRELIAVNGKPLPKDKQGDERRKLQEEISRRRRESPDDRAHRIAEFEKEEKRDHRFIEEFVQAFDFKSAGERKLRGHEVYVVDAIPRPDYHATDRDSQVLKGMRGRLFIDKKTYHWVRAEAEVVHPVSIEGFVATVEPGTRFLLDKTPVSGGVWLAKHFSMTAKAEIFSFISHNKHEDVIYSNYHKATTPTD